MTDPETNGTSALSLGTAAARTLASTTKTPPQMQAVSPRWLLRMLPWVETAAGTYRVNRRLSFTVGDGVITLTADGDQLRPVPYELGELPHLRGFDDLAVLEALAGRFVQREIEPGTEIVQLGQQLDQVLVLAHGKATKLGRGKYGDETVVDTLGDGSFVGEQALSDEPGVWPFTVRANTPCTVLTLARTAFNEIRESSPSLFDHLQRTRPQPARNKYGEAPVEIAAGHTGEPELPATFVDYELKPREYELSVAQTVLRVHSRVADLYNQPMDQTGEQLRLTIEELRERQEYELINNPEFGLIHNTDPRQRIRTRTGPPTPDDFDELLSRRRKSEFFLAHPRTIAAFGRECSRRHLSPPSVEVRGTEVLSWRGVPVLPSDKIPITEDGTSSVLVMRTGEKNQGVIGLHQTGLPCEAEPGLNTRFMGIDEKAIISYLVSTYYSAAVLVPDALGVLEQVEINR